MTLEMTVCSRRLVERSLPYCAETHGMHRRTASFFPICTVFHTGRAAAVPLSVFGAANRLQTARAPRAGDPRAVGLQSRVDRGVRTRGLLATRALSASPAPEGGFCGPSLMQSHFTRIDLIRKSTKNERGPHQKRCRRGVKPFSSSLRDSRP